MAFMLACVSRRKSQNRLLISSGEGELDYFSLMPFVWRKRCWLTAELLDPTQPGFSADAWLMRSTTGIIIRQGILAFSCVSQAGKKNKKPSCCSNVVGRFSASVFDALWTRSRVTEYPFGVTLSCLQLVTINGRRSYGGNFHRRSTSTDTKAAPKHTNDLLLACWQ